MRISGWSIHLDSAIHHLDKILDTNKGKGQIAELVFEWALQSERAAQANRRNAPSRERPTSTLHDTQRRLAAAV